MPAYIWRTSVERSPNSVNTIQVDGESEFWAEFEQACREKGVRLFVLPLRSLNAQRSCGLGGANSY